VVTRLSERAVGSQATVLSESVDPVHLRVCVSVGDCSEAWQTGSAPAYHAGGHNVQLHLSPNLGCSAWAIQMTALLIGSQGQFHGPNRAPRRPINFHNFLMDTAVARRSPARAQAVGAVANLPVFVITKSRILIAQLIADQFRPSKLLRDKGDARLDGCFVDKTGATVRGRKLPCRGRGQ
jgi:hypothetical protein